MWSKLETLEVYMLDRSNIQIVALKVCTNYQERNEFRFQKSVERM